MPITTAQLVKSALLSEREGLNPNKTLMDTFSDLKKYTTQLRISREKLLVDAQVDLLKAEVARRGNLYDMYVKLEGANGADALEAAKIIQKEIANMRDNYVKLSNTNNPALIPIVREFENLKKAVNANKAWEQALTGTIFNPNSMLMQSSSAMKNPAMLQLFRMMEEIAPGETAITDSAVLADYHRFKKIAEAAARTQTAFLTQSNKDFDDLSRYLDRAAQANDMSPELKQQYLSAVTKALEPTGVLDVGLARQQIAQMEAPDQHLREMDRDAREIYDMAMKGGAAGEEPLDQALGAAFDNPQFVELAKQMGFKNLGSSVWNEETKRYEYHPGADDYKALKKFYKLSQLDPLGDGALALPDTGTIVRITKASAGPDAAAYDLGDGTYAVRKDPDTGRETYLTRAEYESAGGGPAAEPMAQLMTVKVPLPGDKTGKNSYIRVRDAADESWRYYQVVKIGGEDGAGAGLNPVEKSEIPVDASAPSVWESMTYGGGKSGAPLRFATAAEVISGDPKTPALNTTAIADGTLGAATPKEASKLSQRPEMPSEIATTDKPPPGTGRAETVDATYVMPDYTAWRHGGEAKIYRLQDGTTVSIPVDDPTQKIEILETRAPELDSEQRRKARQNVREIARVQASGATENAPDERVVESPIEQRLTRRLGRALERGRMQAPAPIGTQVAQAVGDTGDISTVPAKPEVVGSGSKKPVGRPELPSGVEARPGETAEAAEARTAQEAVDAKKLAAGITGAMRETAISAKAVELYKQMTPSDSARESPDVLKRRARAEAEEWAKQHPKEVDQLAMRLHEAVREPGVDPTSAEPRVVAAHMNQAAIERAKAAKVSGEVPEASGIDTGMIQPEEEPSKEEIAAAADRLRHVHTDWTPEAAETAARTALLTARHTEARMRAAGAYDQVAGSKSSAQPQVAQVAATDRTVGRLLKPGVTGIASGKAPVPPADAPSVTATDAVSRTEKVHQDRIRRILQRGKPKRARAVAEKIGERLGKKIERLEDRQDKQYERWNELFTADKTKNADKMPRKTKKLDRIDARGIKAGSLIARLKALQKGYPSPEPPPKPSPEPPPEKEDK